MNEKFVYLSEIVSEQMGNWRVTFIALIALVLWIGLGPLMHYSDTWQLIANTPTTWLELFIGFLLAAAANRSEKRVKQILEMIEKNQEQEMQQLQNDYQIIFEENEILKKENEILKGMQVTSQNNTKSQTI